MLCHRWKKRGRSWVRVFRRRRDIGLTVVVVAKISAASVVLMTCKYTVLVGELNSASYSQQDGNWVVGYRHSVADLGYDMSASWYRSFIIIGSLWLLSCWKIVNKSFCLWIFCPKMLNLQLKTKNLHLRKISGKIEILSIYNFLFGNLPCLLENCNCLFYYFFNPHFHWGIRKCVIQGTVG